MMMCRSAWMLGLAATLGAACSGCRSTGPDHLPRESERVAMLSLMLPHEVHIQPFSKIASFNEDRIPDGILAVVRPVDPFGDPVKAVGLFYFELWSYRNASGDHKGERLEFWDQMIDNPEDVRRHWKRAQMYEFQLAWTQGAGAVQPGRKYILTVSYRTPWDTTIQDEHVLEFHLPGESLTGIPDGRDAQTGRTP
ncbi:MAG: hypothetical protein GXY55_11255 [Phycisphaerae bacterium]|nr:hypothetical protein [Phycisphaerae bacterium]